MCCGLVTGCIELWDENLMIIVDKGLRKFGENEVGSYMSLYIFPKPAL